MSEPTLANTATENPYDVPDTCRCSAWSENECACGGYVDRGKLRAWQRGYDAAVQDLARGIEYRTLHRIQGGGDWIPGRPTEDPDETLRHAVHLSMRMGDTVRIEERALGKWTPVQGYLARYSEQVTP